MEDWKAKDSALLCSNVHLFSSWIQSLFLHSCNVLPSDRI